MPNLWQYDEKPLRDDVKLNLPQGWTLRVVKIISGDSGKPYWGQILWDEKGNIVLTACQCPEGFFKIPLTGRVCCKHIENYLAFREEKQK